MQSQLGARLISRTAITRPSGSTDRPSVVVTTRDGRKYSGRIRSEGNFSLQLQTLDGAFHFLARSDIEHLEIDPQTLMPTDYASTLNSREFDDLISYLMVSAKTSESTPTERTEERE